VKGGEIRKIWVKEAPGPEGGPAGELERLYIRLVERRMEEKGLSAGCRLLTVEELTRRIRKQGPGAAR
jgi:hypothetical protein